MTRNLALPVVIGLAALLPGASASAAPLEPAACEQLRQDLGTLEKAGARNNFAKGAAWAKANLKPEQLQQIEQLIDTEAQFLFRCPQPKRQFDAATEAALEHGTGSDPDPDAAKPEADATKTAVPVKKAAPRPKAPVAAAVPAEAAATAPAPPKPKRTAAKPKPDDAFVPPSPPKSVLAPPAAAPAQ